AAPRHIVDDKFEGTKIRSRSSLCYPLGAGRRLRLRDLGRAIAAAQEWYHEHGQEMTCHSEGRRIMFMFMRKAAPAEQPVASAEQPAPLQTAILKQMEAKQAPPRRKRIDSVDEDGGRHVHWEAPDGTWHDEDVEYDDAEDAEVFG